MALCFDGYETEGVVDLILAAAYCADQEQTAGEVDDANPFDSCEPWNGWPAWQSSLHDQERQTLYPIAGDESQLREFVFGPRLLTVLGAVPGMGKTMLAMQGFTNILCSDEQAVAVVASVDVPPEDLLDRNVACFESRLGYFAW